MDQNKLKIYQEMLKKGLAEQPRIEEIVEQVLRNELKNIFLVGCGGSLACMYPCKYILETNSQLPVYIYNAGEFNTIRPVQFNQNSLLVLSSYSGKTPETVAAANYAGAIGATTIGFTGEGDSPLGQAVDYVFTNQAETGVTASKIVLLYQIVFNLIKRTDNFQQYDQIMAALATLPESLVQIKQQVEERARQFAKDYQDQQFFMILGAGPCWGETYSYATCILEEMQWIPAQPVHAGEFFHGSFEIVRDDTNIIIFKGEDKSRPVTERAETFSKKYSQRVTVIDTKDYELPGVPAELRGYLSPLVLSAVMDLFSHYLATARNHPLSTRKYMGKVDY